MRAHKLISLGVMILVLATVLVAGGLFGCTTPAEQEEEEPPIEEWNIPQICILTGPAASFGLEAVWGVERAIKEINDAGGIRGLPVRVMVYDTAYDPAKAVTVMTQVLGTEPLVIIGPMDQTGAEVSGDLAVQEGVPFITSLASDELREIFAPWGCSLYPDNKYMIQAGVREYLQLNPDIKSVVWFYCPASSGHVELTGYAEEELERLGVELLGKIECTFGQLDFGPTAIKAMDLNPEGYISTLNAPEGAGLAIELYERGMTEGRRFCSTFGASSAIYYDLAEGYLEDTYIFDPYSMDYEGAEWQAYVEAFMDDHDGGLPYSMAISGQYDAVYAIKAAIESLEITGDPERLSEERIAIRDFLWNAVSLRGCQGPYDYVAGQKVGLLHLFQIHDNVPVLIKTI